MTKEEAIEIIRDARCTSPLRDALETLIPELRESEDERIRKDLITYLKSVQGETLDLTISVPKWIAYLEKQKEQKPLSPDEKMNHSLYLEGFNVGREVGKVEAEQKPEDRFEEAREKYQVEWSEEEEQMFGNILNHYSLIEAPTDGNGISKERYLAFIKSLHPQPKQEWSEEDEKDIVHILKVLDDCYIYGKHDLSKTDYDNLTNTLKSLRPQPHWKPSEEQMSMLRAIVNDPNNVGAESCHLAMQSLYNDLLKLKGGIAPMRDIDE